VSEIQLNTVKNGESCGILDKSEGQLLEDTFTDGADEIFGLSSPSGVSALVSPDDDDQLVNRSAQVQLNMLNPENQDSHKYERRIGSNHVVEGGGDAVESSSGRTDLGEP
jgi:hypothetical protein